MSYVEGKSEVRGVGHMRGGKVGHERSTPILTFSFLCLFNLRINNVYFFYFLFFIFLYFLINYPFPGLLSRLALFSDNDRFLASEEGK